MSKEKLKTDDYDVDADLNMQEFDFGDSFDSEATDKKSRNPVLSVSKGLITGTVNRFKELK